MSNTDCESTATPVYAESYLYNSKALVSSKTITTGGVNYTTSSTYDSYGRPSELTYPTVGSITGPKIRTDYSYGAAYKTTDYSSGSAGTVYHLTTAVNARGQSTGVTYGNTVTATFSYEDATGWLTDNTVKKGTTTIQSYGYDFDDVGNVTNRQLGYGIGSSANLTETFEYDDLHRLERRVVNSALNLSGALAMTESYGYDAMGNLTSKPGVGNYSFTYDANGNVTNDSKRSFTYTAFEKPSKIQQNNDYTDFEYGPNRELIKRIDKRGNNITSTLMLDGYEQITLPTGVVEHKYSVGDAIITKRSNGANETYYLHKDQQGSTTAITNAAGNTVQQLMYDPWGKQYVVNTSLLTYTSPATSKGYTGHEMVNDFEVIHMGGRTYNPVLGRFMQADPFIQSLTNLQSYNRYSYVLNNPMSYTDPSGYFFKKLGKLIKDNWRNLASIAVGYVTFGLGTGIWSLAEMGSLTFGSAVGWGAAAGAASGFVSTGSLRGALSGAISGAAFGAIGRAGLGGVESFAASGLAGGILSDVQGGKFGHGFVSAGIGAAVGGRFGQNPYAQVIGAAVVGGTISAVTGGKFANGAVGAAFAAALRADWDNNPVPKDSRVAFVGGAADDNPLGGKVVKQMYQRHIDRYGEETAAYFEWTEHDKLAAWIDQAKGDVTVIAHSYGADMAAQVVANGHSVNRLVTVDPVGWLRPDMAQVAANTRIWNNYDAGNSLNNWSNIVATIGGAWNNAPANYATTHRAYEWHNHVSICEQFCKY